MAEFKVLVADDCPLLRLGLTSAIERTPGLSVCGTANSVDEALDGLLTLQPDVTVVAFAGSGASTLALLRAARRRHHRPPILALLPHEDLVLARRLLLAGAWGFIRRSDSPARFLESIQQMAQGKGPVASQADSIANAPAHLMGSGPSSSDRADHSLTVREQEILELIGNGSTPREIAGILRLSVKTVESHRENIKQKLGIKSAAKLALFAFQWQQLPPGCGA